MFLFHFFKKKSWEIQDFRGGGACSKDGGATDLLFGQNVLKTDDNWVGVGVVG